MPQADLNLTVVLMAKPIVHGKVKTRLARGIGADHATAVYAAMLDCILQRLVGHFTTQPTIKFLLAIDETLLPKEQRHLDPLEGVQIPPAWEMVHQGSGTLGDRIARVWLSQVRGPAVFLGADCPDIPIEHLHAITPALNRADGTLGPTEDGGYWVLAANNFHKALLDRIDWGTPKVYHQTLAAAAAAGLTIAELPQWQDVDNRDDLSRLRQRLLRPSEPALEALRATLESILKGTPQMNLPEPDTAEPSTDATTDAPPPTTTGPVAVAGASQEELDFSDSTILIVDDNAQNLELLQAYLETLHCKTITATDGIDAMKIIEDPNQEAPDLILLDVMMPRMSGFEVCRKIKEDPATRAIPVMMVTALNELGDIERGVESGTDDFLTKPVNKLELITRVKSLLRVRHLKRELDRTMAYVQTMQGAAPASEQDDTSQHSSSEPQTRMTNPPVNPDDPGAGPVA